VFNDPVLNSLMHEAYGQNLNLRQAGERIAQARFARAVSIGNLFPQFQQASGSHTVNKISDRTANPLHNQWFQDVNVGLNIGWEIDFWGRYRRSIEAADASLDASVADFDNVMVLLLAEVARNYIQYRTFQERLYLARQNAEIQRQAYELAENHFRGGVSTERDMQQARQAYEQTRSLIPQLERGVRLANNALCALLGIPVQDLSPRLGESGVIPQGPADVAIGIPADLLRRRPDVRQAERLAAVQSALIGVSEADLYPRFFLNGSIGLNAEYIGGLWHTPTSMAGSFGPSFQWNILNYGRIESAVAGQEARFREFVNHYQQTVLQADREAEDAIISFAKSKEREVFLTDSVNAAQRTVQITYDQYRAGTVDFTPVFIFETTLTEQEDALAESRGDIALSLVELYRALGGGWEARLEPQGVSGPATMPAAPTTQRASGRPDLLSPTTTRASPRPR
jgi:NodT family efflux transporter outer membrane factor (OMF) lipoprotein